MNGKFAVYLVRGLETETEFRYTVWLDSQDRAEEMAESFVQQISCTDSDIHTVRVLNGVGDKVWEMEVA